MNDLTPGARTIATMSHRPLKTQCAFRIGIKIFGALESNSVRCALRIALNEPLDSGRSDHAAMPGPLPSVFIEAPSIHREQKSAPDCHEVTFIAPITLSVYSQIGKLP